MSGNPVTMAVPEVKEQVRNAIYAQRERFIRLAHEIHAHPELTFTEEHAAACITQV